MELNGRQRRALRALAHDLNPVVQVGKSGATAAVLAAVQEALDAHELIKIKLPQVDKGERTAMAQALEGGVAAAFVGLTGRVLILYRPHPKEPVIELPA